VYPHLRGEPSCMRRSALLNDTIFRHCAKFGLRSLLEDGLPILVGQRVRGGNLACEVPSHDRFHRMEPGVAIDRSEHRFVSRSENRCLATAAAPVLAAP